MDEIMERLTNIIKAATRAVESNEIYQHGYPEARLIPANWKEDCEDSFKENVTECMSEVIADYLDSLFSKGETP